MSAEMAVGSVLHDDATVTSFAGKRIYGGVAKPETPVPFIVFRKAPGTQREYEMDVGQTVVVTAYIQVSVWAHDYTLLKRMADAVRIALTERGGGEPDGVELIDDVPVLGIQVSDEGEDLVDPERGWFGQDWTFEVKHRE